MQGVETTGGWELHGGKSSDRDGKACGRQRTMHAHLAYCPAPLPHLLSQSRMLTPLNRIEDDCSFSVLNWLRNAINELTVM